MASRNKRLGEILVEESDLKPEQLEKALKLQAEKGGLLGANLLQLRAINEEQLLASLSKQLGIPFLSDENLAQLKVSRKATRLVPHAVAEKECFQVLDFDKKQGLLSVVMSDPTDHRVIDELKIVGEVEDLQIFIARSESIHELIKRSYKHETETSGNVVMGQLLERKQRHLSSSQAIPRATESILVFEHDSTLLDSIVSLLQREGLKCQGISTEAGVLGILKKQSFDDLIVKSDVVGERGSFEQSVRELSPSIRIHYVDSFSSLILESRSLFDNEVSRFCFDVLDFVISMLDIGSGKYRAHAHSVAMYAKSLGEANGLDPEFLGLLYLAAYMHDFEKLMQADKRHHGEKLMELLQTLNAPNEIVEILSQSRERYDGQGIPQRLKGEEIHLGARILGVVNAYDELYRHQKAGGEDNKKEVLQKLQERGGKSIDPNQVALFSQVVNEVRAQSTPSNYRILIAVSLENIRFLLSSTLMSQQYEVKTLDTNVISKKIVTNFRPNLTITDCDISNKRNLRELRRIKTTLGNTASVLLVATDDKKQALEEQDEVSIDGVVTEPVDLKVLIAKVERLLDSAQIQDAKTRSAASFYNRAGKYFRSAELYAQVGDYSNAAKMYELANSFGLAAKMAEKGKNFRSAAKYYEQAGDYREAARCYGEIGKLDDQARVLERTGDYYYAAKSKLARGELNGALTLFRRISPEDKKYRKACYFLAKILLEQHKWLEAIKQFEIVIGGEDPNKENLRYYYNIAVSYEQLQQFDRAVQIYEKILGVDYHFRDVLTRVGMLRSRLKQIEDESQMRSQVPAFQEYLGNANQPQSNRYEKRAAIGRGGMGVVYEAQDLVLGRTVALKVLSAAFREDQMIVDTFYREAKAAAMLNHVNIVTVYDAGIEDNNYFIAMELIEGKTLKQVMRGKALPFEDSLQIVSQICSGLSYAHSKKIIHRDLTSHNVMMTRENLVKIMDFGLARMIENLMSEQSIIGGTPSYMSPEQVLGDPIDHRTDIYSLGVTFFEIVTGKLPFLKGDLGYHHLHTQAPDPGNINPSLPKNVRTAILKCLEKKPSDRYQSIDEFADDLNI